MKAIVVGKDLAMLTEEDGWASSNEDLRKALESESSRIMADYSPANGIGRWFLFQQIVNLLEPSEVIDDEEEPVEDEDPERIY